MPLTNIKRDLVLTCEACHKQILLCCKCGKNLKTGTKVWCLKSEFSKSIHLCLVCNNGHNEVEKAE